MFHSLSGTGKAALTLQEQEHTMNTKVSDIDNKRIGLIIKLAREKKFLTADQLATSIECARPTLSLYESGTRPVPANRVAGIAKALDLDPRLVSPEAA
jgi:DNA-binding XRE family transcriptional regulator